jgi:hypothetical protein
MASVDVDDNAILDLQAIEDVVLMLEYESG